MSFNGDVWNCSLTLTEGVEFPALLWPLPRPLFSSPVGFLGVFLECKSACANQRSGPLPSLAPHPAYQHDWLDRVTVPGSNQAPTISCTCCREVQLICPSGWLWFHVSSLPSRLPVFFCWLAGDYMSPVWPVIVIGFCFYFSVNLAAAIWSAVLTHCISTFVQISVFPERAFFFRCGDTWFMLGLQKRPNPVQSPFLIQTMMLEKENRKKLT